MLVLFSVLIISYISGSVYDETGKPLKNANVVIMKTDIGCATDSNGNFLLNNVPLGENVIIASMIGYQPETVKIKIEENKNYYLNFKLQITPIEIESILVTPNSFPLMYRINSDGINANPEQFFLPRILSSLPGISTMEDYSSQISVRGGDPDENLTCIDGFEFFYPTHFGQFGGNGGAMLIIPNMFIDRIDFYPGGFSAKYGNILSSVTDIKLKEEKSFSPFFDINVVDMTWAITSSRLLFSYRKSHLNLINKLQKVFQSDIALPKYEDIFGKFNLQITPKNKVSLLSCFSKDQLYFCGSAIYKYGLYLKDIEYNNVQNQYLQGLSWQYLVFPNMKFFINLSNNVFHWDTYQKRKGQIVAQTQKIPFNIILTTERSELGFGYHSCRFYYNLILFPDTTPTMIIIPGDTLCGKDNFNSYSGYYVGNFFIKSNILMMPSFRIEYWKQLDKIINNPRIALNYSISKVLNLRFSLGKFSQIPRYDYLVINKNLNFENAYHFIAGLKYENSNNNLTVNIYQKTYKDLVSIPTDSFSYFFIRESIDNSSTGYAKGIEVNIERQFVNRIYLLANYTYSISKRSIGNVEYYADWDQRHIFNILLNIAISKQLDLTTRFRFASGQPYTPILDRLQHPVYGKWLPILGKINSVRYPNYSRLDMCVNYRMNFYRYNLYLYLNIWNVYNRKNILTYVWDDDYKNKQEIHQFLFTPNLGLKVNF